MKIKLLHLQLMILPSRVISGTSCLVTTKLTKMIDTIIFGNKKPFTSINSDMQDHLIVLILRHQMSNIECIIAFVACRHLILMVWLEATNPFTKLQTATK